MPLTKQCCACLYCWSRGHSAGLHIYFPIGKYCVRESELEAGKPTVRLENVLRVIDALGGEIELSGLPGQREGGEHTA